MDNMDNLDDLANDLLNSINNADSGIDAGIEAISALMKMWGEDSLSGAAKAAYLGLKVDQLNRQIETSPKFMNLPDDSEIVQSLIKLRETEIEVLKKILNKIQ